MYRKFLYWLGYSKFAPANRTLRNRIAHYGWNRW